jgi:hypothetical protein
VIRPVDGPAIALLLDLENLLHDQRRISGDAIRSGFGELMRELRRLGRARYAVGACDFWLAKALCPTAQSLGVRVFPGRTGPDRADGELLARGARDLPSSVDVVVIGSGDGAFTPLVRVQQAAGRRVVVAGRPGRISRALAEAADEVIVLDLAPQPVAA